MNPEAAIGQRRQLPINTAPQLPQSPHIVAALLGEQFSKPSFVLPDESIFASDRSKMDDTTDSMNDSVVSIYFDAAESLDVETIVISSDSDEELQVVAAGSSKAKGTSYTAIGCFRDLTGFFFLVGKKASLECEKMYKWKSKNYTAKDVIAAATDDRPSKPSKKDNKGIDKLSTSETIIQFLSKWIP